jgi:phosphonate transport system substrate-binding protein
MAQNESRSKIAEFRERARLSQRELAERVKVTEATIANWERGRRAIDFIEKLIRLCDALRCDVRDLIEQPLDLQEVSLPNEDLTDRNLNRANLRLANLSNAILVGNSLMEANLSGANLQKANLERADLRRANLEAADLTGANLKEANLEGAIFRGAVLTNADLRATNWQSADFESANLSDAMLVASSEDTNLSGAMLLEDVGENLPLVLGGIPDQDFGKLADMYGKLADYLQEEIGIEARSSYSASSEHRSLMKDQDYGSTITAFRLGNVDMAWLGGFTALEALREVPGAKTIAQRNIDQEFRTILIGNRDRLSFLGKFEALEPDGENLEILQRLRQNSPPLKFTFGGKLSTSGDLIPLHYLVKAGLDESCFGKVRFSGSHDATIRLVETGLCDVGVVNIQVWNRWQEESPLSKIVKLWQSPPYQNYAWVMHPNALKNDKASRIQRGLVSLKDSEKGREILKFFGDTAFVQTSDDDYSSLRAIAEKRESDRAFFWKRVR